MLAIQPLVEMVLNERHRFYLNERRGTERNKIRRKEKSTFVSKA